MNEPTIELTPYLSDTQIRQLASQNGLSYEEIRGCLTKDNPKQCIEEKKRIKNTNLKKKIEEEEKGIKIEEEHNNGIAP